MTTSTDIKKAVLCLRAGQLVAFPTETVYGLGADAENEEAIHQVFAAKERPYSHPLIVHIEAWNQVTRWAAEIPPVATQLAQAFWPGPLTLVLQKKAHVLACVTGAQETVALRAPRHPVAQALLNAFGGALVAPSANRFTHVSPTTAQAVKEELGDRVAMILDGGSCQVGLESTIVDVSSNLPVILRPGMITREAIAHVLQQPVTVHPSSIRVPGMHSLHYAPKTQTRCFEKEALLHYIETATLEKASIAVVTHGLERLPAHVHVQRMPKDAIHYAQVLYQTLRVLDQGQFEQIIIEAVPLDSGWEAIRDRLSKASARR